MLVTLVSLVTLGILALCHLADEQDKFNATISGCWEEPGSLNTSRGAQPANKTKISHMSPGPHSTKSQYQKTHPHSHR